MIYSGTAYTDGEEETQLVKLRYADDRFLIFDTGPEGAMDRYTVIDTTPEFYEGYGNSYTYFGFSEDPGRGIGQHGESRHEFWKNPDFLADNKRIFFADLPDTARPFVQRFMGTDITYWHGGDPALEEG